MSSKKDLVARGQYGTSRAGTATFIGLRAIDPVLQYGILTYGAQVLNKVGIAALPSAELAASGLTRDVGFGILGLGLPLKSVVLLAMAVGASVKQIYWMSVIGNEPLGAGNAAMIAGFNTVFNGLSSFLSLTLLSSRIWSGSENHFDAVTVAGIAMYGAGILAEAVSETQRKLFKDDAKNKGKVYTGGLFGLARHINYGGYTLWRAGYALVAGGPIWGALFGGVFAYDFITRAVPALDDYCSDRYGVQWEAYKKKTSWKLWPGIY